MLMLISLFIAALNASPYSALERDNAWKEEITFDFFNLDFKANFDNWKQVFGKNYASDAAEKTAFETFMFNWKFINEFNQKGRSYKLRMNQFSDMTRKQFRRYIHGGSDNSCVRKRTVQERIKMKEFINRKSIKAPTSIDWTDYNGKSYVTPVKNQGQCGSCWAFSATGSTESRTAIATQTTGSSITTLSEQQLVDCSRAEGNLGCNGGLMDSAFKYIIKEGGLCSEAEYPYTARNGECKATSCGTKYDALSSYKDVQHESEPSLVDAVAEGPVSVAVEADQSAFQFYSSGVLDGKCGTNLDHGVLVVGYGSESGQDYWKVKNSWGKTWGMEGYLLICRNCNKNGKQGECGILDTPSYPIPKASVSKRSPNFIYQLLKKLKW